MNSSTLRQLQNRLATNSKRLIASALVLTLAITCSPSVWLTAHADAKTTELSTKDEKTSRREGLEAKLSAQNGHPAHQTHMLAASYYSVADNLTATLMLLNQGTQPLEVQPTLFSRAGERLDVPPMILEGRRLRAVNLREWVANAGPSFQQGNLQVLYHGQYLVLGGVVQMINAERGLIFDEELVEPAKAFSSSRLEGVWWLPSHRHEILLAISNTTDSSSSVTANIAGATLKEEEPLVIDLSPHETRLVNIRKQFGAKRTGWLPKAGGISISHSGPKGAIIARAFVQEPTTGYSAVIEFSDPLNAKTSQLHGAGLRLGQVEGEELESVVVMRNVDDTETVVTGRIPYSDGVSNMSTVSVPTIRLAAGEVRSVNLTSIAKRTGVKEADASAGLEFEHTGKPGSVVMSALSIGRNGDHVFRVPLIDPAAQQSSAGGYPWMIEGTSSTFIYIKNVTDHSQHYTFYVDVGQDMHAFGLRTVEAGQTVVLDVRALRDNQVPDAQGRTIPLEVTQGRVHWSVSGPKDRVLIGRAEQVNVAGGMSSTSACGYPCPNSYWAAWIVPDDILSPAIGEVSTHRAYQQDQHDFYGVLPPYETYPYWWSSNPSVMSISGSAYNPAYGTAHAVGDAYIYADWSAYQYNYDAVYDECFATLVTIALLILAEVVETPCTVSIIEETISGPNPPVRNPARIRRMFAPVFEATPSPSRCRVRWSLTGPGSIIDSLTDRLVTVNGNAVGNIFLRATTSNGSFAQIGVPVVNQQVVDVRVYIVRSTDGSVAAVNQTRVNNDIADANQIWEQCGIQFSLVSTSFLNSDTFLDPPDEPTRALLRNQHAGTGGIEVYYVNSFPDELDTTGATTPDGMLIATGAGANSRTVAHELGHAMGLPGNPHRSGAIPGVSLMDSAFSTTIADLILNECNSLSRFTSN